MDFSKLLEIRTTFGVNQDDVPEQEDDLRRLVFNREEKLGKFVDFNLGSVHQQITQQQQPQVEQEEFVMVESKAEQILKNKLKNQNKIRVQQTKQQQMGMTSYIPPKGKQRFKSYQKTMQVRTKFKESGFVKADWEMIMEIQKQQIDKVAVQDEIEREEIFRFGKLGGFDKSLLSKLKKEQDLKMDFEVKIHTTTSEDPFMNILLSENIEDDDVDTSDKPTKIFITEEILMQMMSLKFQVVPWDIKVLKEKNLLIFDKFEKRDENNNYVLNYIDMVTTNENISTNMPEEEKEFIDICKESTFVQNSYLKRAMNQTPLDQEVDEAYQELIQEEIETIKQDNEDYDTLINMMNYKYVKFSFNGMEVFLRLNLEGYMKSKSEDDEEEVQEVMAKCFNQYDLSEDMRKKLQTNKGALITQESKNNLCKMIQWLSQANLKEIDQIKLGFITRQSASDAKKQTLLSVEDFNVKELEQILNFKMKEQWGVFKYLVNQIQAQPKDDYYALVKVPFKPNVKIYHIPDQEE